MKADLNRDTYCQNEQLITVETLQGAGGALVLVCKHCAHIFKENELLIRSCPVCMSNHRFLEYFVTMEEANDFKHGIIEAYKEREHYPSE